MRNRRDTKQINDFIAEHGLRPSSQRIAILSYLMEHPVHPTAEEIHKALVDTIPTLSLTTVYNTLRLMSGHKVVNTLNIDPKNARFDYIDHPHAHIWCRKCGRIYDFHGRDEAAPPSAQLPGGFQVEEVEVYYKGICKECMT